MKTHRLVLIQDHDFNPLHDFDDNDETVIYLPSPPYYYNSRVHYSGADLDSLHKSTVETVVEYHEPDTRIAALVKHFQRNGFDTDVIEADYYNREQDALIVRKRDRNEDPDHHWTNKDEIQAWMDGKIYIVVPQRKATYRVMKTPLDPPGPTTTTTTTEWVEDDDIGGLGGCILTEDYTAYDVARDYFAPVYSNPKETEIEYVY